MRILVVCTGNICRSPMAAAMLRVGARVVGVPVQVASAGTHAVVGRGADADAMAEMADRGISLSSHRSHQLVGVDIRAAEVIIAMAREHVLAVGTEEPTALPRTFTLRELVRLGRSAGPRSSDEALEGWLARLATGRTPASILAGGADNDHPDPYGLGRRAFRRTGDDLDGDVWALLDLLAGYHPRA